MAKQCDHTSVGVFVRDGDKLLLIERARPPYGFAVPAGHVDGDATFEIAAARELKEEVGLDAGPMKLIFEGRKNNPCRRDGGTWHEWRLYDTTRVGELRRSEDETKRANWYDKDEIRLLAGKTEARLGSKISDEEWDKSPGLEPVMYEFFKELKLI
ncbi:MAG: NUDIX domain-containing protein [Candidatus Paceibacterota bacterium]|jgi:ADP-ribose pyrophosphatase YjhB (NUDIX family)